MADRDTVLNVYTELPCIMGSSKSISKLIDKIKECRILKAIQSTRRTSKLYRGDISFNKTPPRKRLRAKIRIAWTRFFYKYYFHCDNACYTGVDRAQPCRRATSRLRRFGQYIALGRQISCIRYRDH